MPIGYFNSYMVRLEAYEILDELLDAGISIPIWCDWKREPILTDLSKIAFQFLYGAIGSKRTNVTSINKEISIPIWCDWKHSSFLFTSRERLISIPIWCDWKFFNPSSPYISFYI